LKVEKMSDDTKKVSWPASGGHVRQGARKTTAITDFFTIGQVADLSFSKIQSVGIRAVRENQRIIRCDVRDRPPACNVYSRSVQVTTPA
jgi:hypothetical protein